MPRPRKHRRICSVPSSLEFGPKDSETRKTETTENIIFMTMDEYEAIRLIDHEGFSQEQCSEFMQVARTTVQQIYASARSKLASMLVDGTTLHIEGGDIQLCKGHNSSCWKDRCLRQEISAKYAHEKGEQTMRIAVPYENGEIFGHFGRTETFKVYDTENGKIVSSQVLSTEGNGHGALAGILAALKTDLLICGGIGPGARNALHAAGIECSAGHTGSADEAVQNFLNGTLAPDQEASCNYHDHEHGQKDHACGNHGCHDHDHSGNCHH